MSLDNLISRWLPHRTRPSRSRPAGLHKAVLRVEELEHRDLLAAIPVSFVVPSAVANKGVYVAVTANTGTGAAPIWGYVQSATATSYTPSQGLTQLPLLTLFSPATKTRPVQPVTVSIPDVSAISGQIVIFVGSNPPLMVDSSTGAVTSPNSYTNPTDIFGLFEYSYVDGDLDIDLSLVDQVGFPFTITSNPAGAPPAQNGVGLMPNRQALFDAFNTFVASQNAPDFQKSVTNGNGYRIVAPQNVVNTIEGQPVQGVPTLSTGGNLTLGQTYYYVITATSATGESMASNVQNVTPYNKSVGGKNVPQQTVTVNWDQYANATGYKVYRSTSPQMTDSALIATINSGATLSYTDAGATGNPAMPPANNYTFDPLNSYFNSALDEFFEHYETNTFSLLRDGHTFTGMTNTSYQIDGHTYTVLKLTSTDLPNQDFLIIKPYFSSNTNMANAPPPPSWLKNATQSPGGMVMANDGVFNTGGQQPGADAGILSDLQNSIVTAFNRGIATNFNIAPNNWVFVEALDSATPVAGGQLASGTYYYVITGVNNLGETSVSNEQMVTSKVPNNSVRLAWKPQDTSVYTHYKIYRGTGAGAEQLIDTIVNDGTTSGYTDTGANAPTTPPPFTFYAAGTLSNWYAAYLHQTNVSIGGLAYGFGYDDQGGFSTNFVIANPLAVTITLQPWTSGAVVWGGLALRSHPRFDKVNHAHSPLDFQALSSAGAPLFGGADVKVRVIGWKGRAFTVQTDYLTGLAAVGHEWLPFGRYRIKLSANGHSALSNWFWVHPLASLRELLDRSP